MATLQKVKTEYIEAVNGVTYAYRRLGPEQGVPLVLHIHFRANMDFWDPLFINTLAAARQVIIFDQAGVGRSTGTVPTTFQAWANDLISLVDALNIKLIDLFGFSLGGCAVQMVALTKPNLIRALVLAGTTASGPFTTISGTVQPRDIAPPNPFKQLATAVSVEEGKAAITYSFFRDDDTGRYDADTYWERLNQRTVEPLILELLDRHQGGARQKTAAVSKEQSASDSWFYRLKELSMPVLVANGDNDILIPTSRSWELLTQIENAKLIIYPRAGHGFLWQYAEEFASDVNRFLDRNVRMKSQSRL